MPVHGRFSSLGSQRIHQLGADDILSEALFLEQLEVLQGRARIYEVLDVGRAGPVSEVAEVCDEGWFVQELLGCEVV